jgi:hypothetical protein
MSNSIALLGGVNLACCPGWCVDRRERRARFHTLSIAANDAHRLSRMIFFLGFRGAYSSDG